MHLRLRVIAALSELCRRIGSGRRGMQGIAECEQCVGIHMHGSVSERLCAGIFAAAVAEPDDLSAEHLGHAVEELSCGIEFCAHGVLFGIARPAAGFGHSRRSLRRDGDEAPLIDIGDIIERVVTFGAAVGSAFDMRTGLFEFIASADGAGLGADRAGDADLLFDACVNLTDEVCIAVRADHIGICAEEMIDLTGLGFAVCVRAKLGAEDAGSLIAGARVVVEDACDADEAVSELFECMHREAVAVAVDLIVTEDEVKEVYLIERMLPLGEAVEQFEQFILIGHRKPPF